MKERRCIASSVANLIPVGIREALDKQVILPLLVVTCANKKIAHIPNYEQVLSLVKNLVVPTSLHTPTISVSVLSKSYTYNVVITLVQQIEGFQLQ